MNTAPAPVIVDTRTITKKLARNGYYQIFADNLLIGHVYLNPSDKGWLARIVHGRAAKAFRTRDAAIASVVEATAKR